MTTRRITLEPVFGSVKEARRFVGDTLRACGITDTALAELATSELVSNAVRHGQPPVSLVVRCAARLARVEVYDGSPDPPRMGPAGGATGNGLVIVDAFTNAWGVEPAGGGKAVWFQFSEPAELQRS